MHKAKKILIIYDFPLFCPFMNQVFSFVNNFSVKSFKEKIDRQQKEFF